MEEALRYVRRDVLNTQVDDDLILFDADAGKYYATTAVGASIWAHLAEPLSLDELCDRLMAEYDVDRATCDSETRAFLKMLLQSGLIKKRTAP